MAVFDFIDRQDSSRPNNETTFNFLNRVAGDYWDGVRSTVDQLFAGFCEESRPDVLGRMRSGDDLDFLGAYWELVLFRALQGHGFTVTCHPEVPGTSKRPDFLAESAKCTFYLEAKALGESRVQRSREAKHSAMYAEIETRVQSTHYYLRIEIDLEGKNQLPHSKLAKWIQRSLDQLDFDEVNAAVSAEGFSAAPELEWCDESSSGWIVTVRPIPKPMPGPDGPVVGAKHVEARWLDEQSAIREALDEKAHRYGSSLDHPLVVALAIDRVFSDDAAVADALFGSESVRSRLGSETAVASRALDGLLIGPNGARCKRLSAALIGLGVKPWSIPTASLRLWEHPEPNLRLGCRSDSIAHVTIDHADAFTVSEPASGLVEVLDLPTPWPVGEPLWT